LNKQIRVSLHAEMQKFGTKPDPTQAIDRSIGLDLTYTEARALFAVQKMLDETNYKGNTTPVSFKDEKDWMYNGQLPCLKISTSEYLDAYGVVKHKTKRNKMEYSGSERTTATDALSRLAGKEFYFQYERIIWGKNRGSRAEQSIEVASPIILLEKDPTGTYRITPSPILVDQIDTYFVRKPVDLYEQPADSILFLEYLLVQSEQKRRTRRESVIRMDPETLAYKLRLDKFIEKRQWKRIRSKLNSLYSLAKDIGYLDGYSIEQEGKKIEKVDVLTLRMAA
jgi:hypothetical protein